MVYFIIIIIKYVKYVKVMYLFNLKFLLIHSNNLLLQLSFTEAHILNTAATQLRNRIESL